MPARRAGKLGAVSLTALCGALAAGPGWATCTQSGSLGRTCSGQIGATDFTLTDTTSDQTAKLTFENATNGGATGPSSGSTAAWNFSVGAPEYSQAPAAAQLNVNLSDGFSVSSSVAQGILVTATGSKGKTHDEDKGTGDKHADDGGAGGTGGVVTATVSGVDVSGLKGGAAIVSAGGDGGYGAEGYSTGFGDGHGGDGGAGGSGGAVSATFTDVKASGLPAISAVSLGGNANEGGEGKSFDYTGHGGVGGVGGAGGSVALSLNSVSADTAVVALSQGGGGGHGGEGKDNGNGNGKGGAGGVGGAGGTVEITNATGGSPTGLQIDTTKSPGLLADSIAGDGGHGGDGDVALGLGNSTGGDGGQGGTAGSVTVSIAQPGTGGVSITTDGTRAPGLFARSYGGAGGKGGTADSSSATGGAGAGSGPSGSVTVDYAGDIHTQGAGSDGIMAQAVGGFSGDGGSASGIVAYGASVESAGDGGAVSVTYSGTEDTSIQTDADDSDAIYAQSQGGGGGKASSTQGLVALSGDSDGGSGGNGGKVSVDVSGVIQTSGERSRGVAAQSIGGTGGDGGDARGFVSIGGTGSGGGKGGAVTVSSTAGITTAGADATGIFAQSVGGGGGAASSTAGLVAIGGTGGSGSTGGNVQVSANGDVATAGTGADGIVAQSIGGSGGHGSNAVGIGVGFSLAISGNGGTGNDGGTSSVTTQSATRVTTKGDNARGIALSSIGGGGGSAGNALSVSANAGPDIAVAIGGSGGAAGDGGDVSGTFAGAITTAGSNATGLSAISVGGSGGSAATTLSTAVGFATLGVSVGGDGSGGGDGGSVDLCRGGTSSSNGCVFQGASGAIATGGDGAAGILAASVGGGGGQSGTTVSSNTGAGVNLAIGGSGGAGGTGDSVGVHSAGGIATTGKASPGLVATSVGGSGGVAHIVGAVGTIGGANLNVAVGGAGGTAGGSGKVSVTSTDTISTGGKLSPGIQAISQAGSGGSGSAVLSAQGISGASANIGIGSAGGSGGKAGAVAVDWTGATLTTSNAQSPGIVAISGGGSGGVGGFTMGGQGLGLGSVDVDVGAKGGKGGTAGDVSVTASGAIKTSGFQSDGISAISQGGNGGRGSGAITVAGISQASATVSLGGGGGSGGQAGDVTVTGNSGAAITTAGANAAGIRALSLGGKGGQGGFAVEAGMNLDPGDGYPQGDASLSIGGDGGGGGSAGIVTIQNKAAITTGDFNSAAIQAQSIGGSGGAGGMAASGTLNVGPNADIDVAVVLGGSGGSGGTAGATTVTNSGVLATTYANSDGIQAQSIGGSGGAGGLTYNVLGNLLAGGHFNTKLDTTIGGAGGGSGTGGDVSVTNSAGITTAGTSSSAIYAQSVGGNGGKGGFGGTGIYNLASNTGEDDTSVGVDIGITVGGGGGASAKGGDVTVDNQSGGAIKTSGAGAHGIFAQSVGGNGGDGGLASNYSGTVAGSCGPVDEVGLLSCKNDDGDTTTVELTLDLALGGKGETGADAGTVKVTNDAAVATSGDVAHGIFAQSVGGGGGTGGATATTSSAFYTRQSGNNNDTVTSKLGSKTTLSDLGEGLGGATILIGGSGNAGGDGAATTVTNSGAVSTTGVNAYGIFAQSVGGGGGSGGEGNSSKSDYTVAIGGSGRAAGIGGDVTITNSGAVTTAGYASAALFAQSIGGGGGNTGGKTNRSALYQAEVTLGGLNSTSDSNSVAGGDVAVTSKTGTIRTGAEQSPGIFAQSVGGGGGTLFGSLGVASDGDPAVVVNGGESIDGNGGAVTVNSQSDIYTGPQTAGTLNAASMGIFAQSVGGGGGYGGSMLLSDKSRIGSTAYNSTEATAHGGPVTVTASGIISTKGDNSVGIFAQSVGGGGGVLGTLDDASTEGAVVGSFGGMGTAGTVSVTYGGKMTTTGDGATGIFAQYAGGTQDGTEGTGTTVDVSVTGSIAVAGAGAHGIHVENSGKGAGAVRISVAEGATVQGGDGVYHESDKSAGVLVHSTQDGTLENAGTIGAKSGIAIHNSNIDSTLTITNTGTINGQVIGPVAQSSSSSAAAAAPYRPAPIRLDNLAGGTLNAGKRVEARRLRNWGAFYVGTANKIGGTRIAGDFRHRAGVLHFDLDMARRKGDLLSVGGNATIDGVVKVNLARIGTLPTGKQSLTIMSADGGIDGSDLKVVPSVVAQYRLRQSSASEIALNYEVDFANDSLLSGVTENQGALSAYFDRVYRAGALDVDLAEQLIDVSLPEIYGATMNALGPELATSNEIARLSGTLRFADSLFSCPDEGAARIWAEDGECAYLTFGANRFSRDASDGASGFDQTGTRIAAGGQALMDNGLALGGSLAYEFSNLTTDAGGSSDGGTAMAGLSLKRFTGNWELGAAAHLGRGSFDNTRTLGAATASGTQGQWVYGAQLRAGYAIDHGAWFVKPRLDLGVTRFAASSYTETGTGGIPLSVDLQDETLFYLRPAVEFGGVFDMAGGGQIRPNVTLMMTQFLGDTSFGATARLAGAPASVAPFDWVSDFDRTQYDLAAGITIVTDGGSMFDLSGFGHMSDNETDFGGRVRWVIPF
ncbi:autotransporter outer membrane beta-barrel domain-containing protein [Chachezhania antarctica]|uniref:autotransporter outer membrane beta-barrel domain-containing protein n=1 Tax=Chachezhania antarctica TaxID=2340860 RepID=UPI0013CE81A7|nr:autotransporter outer membrane beta-barrel domain-containing protein [Chachezhania antarctica]